MTQDQGKINIMTNAPDFEALRAARNKEVQENLQKMADRWGVPLQEVATSFNPNACYCACTSGGPCEHKWDGPWMYYGSIGSSTCFRCGASAYSHDMRCAP